jgi:hypothetical protein
VYVSGWLEGQAKSVIKNSRREGQARRAGSLWDKGGTSWYSHRTGSKKKSREDGQYRDNFQTFSTDFCELKEIELIVILDCSVILE